MSENNQCQGSHSSWKTWKLTCLLYRHAKHMENEKNPQKSWKFKNYT